MLVFYQKIQPILLLVANLTLDYTGFMVILGVDPGTARLGWGVIKSVKSNQKVMHYGCLETKKTDTDSKRLAILFNDFKKLIDRHKPNAIGVEDLFFFKNQKTVIKVSQARGVILLAGELKKIPTFSYSPLQVKMAVTGYGKADKKQVQLMTKSILNLNEIPQPDDAADALAIALTHVFTYKMKNKLK